MSFDYFKTLLSKKLSKTSLLKFLAFSIIFCLIKTDLSGNTVWPQVSDFQKLDFSVIFKHRAIWTTLPKLVYHNMNWTPRKYEKAKLTKLCFFPLHRHLFDHPIFALVVLVLLYFLLSSKKSSNARRQCWRFLHCFDTTSFGTKNKPCLLLENYLDKLVFHFVAKDKALPI